ncbi:agmatine deiminase family protein [Magnetospirillum aberrantis]|uniref:Agmatine deiminase family protein n=1 Tax=Magnetospirillum aberrantis SpK TaxID=908842 RepID=A0A7C9UZH8_9PROT|nr:agmatine deiminase family protein [Magnetospirillum aberrantis]NFV80553.1 hypothetical protein [Magnetospirillum aberrantis SpK]
MAQPVPRDLGWRLAPAWSRPARFWMGWPDFRDDQMAREDCLGLAELLADYAPVSLICSSRDAAGLALRTSSNVAALASSHGGWLMRAEAPLWLVDGDGRLVAGVAFSAVGRELVERAGVPVLEPPVGLPPGIEGDGEGTVLASVPPERRTLAETVLRDWLGVERVLWLEGGDAAGSTRFLAPALVLLPPHPDLHRLLEAARDARGRRLQLVEMPASKREGRCYADCLVAGDTVVVPDYEDGRCGEALARVSAATWGRRISAFPAAWLAPAGAGLGGVVATQPS